MDYGRFERGECLASGRHGGCTNIHRSFALAIRVGRRSTAGEGEQVFVRGKNVAVNLHTGSRTPGQPCIRHVESARQPKRSLAPLPTTPQSRDSTNIHAHLVASSESAACSTSNPPTSQAAKDGTGCGGEREVQAGASPLPHHPCLEHRATSVACTPMTVGQTQQTFCGLWSLRRPLAPALLASCLPCGAVPKIDVAAMQCRNPLPCRAAHGTL